MSTDSNTPNVDVTDVTRYSHIDIHNTGPGRYASNYDYASLVLELHRTGLHVAENDGYITLIGKLSDIPMERGEEGAMFFAPLSERFLSDITQVHESARIAITINVHRVLQWRDHAKFAGRFDLALWSDLLVLSQVMPNGKVRKGTYHYAVLA